MSSTERKVSTTEAARLHIEQIRRTKFSIGSTELNPLTEDLHHAVTNLSAELYTKDVHFLMELIQNAEDNLYPEDVQPTLEFVLTKRDVTGTGASATLVVFNNEIGFSKLNMDSICGVGRSTKKGKRLQGFIGEKGIGFKSVFLVCSQPHIFSNGYCVRFSDAPTSNCGIGYIVPEWIGEQPIVSSVHDIYGPEKDLPTTIIVLPLRLEKVESVKTQLSELHPELLLFLTKIERLSVRVNEGDPKLADSMSVLSVASETGHVDLREKRANSHVLHLSVKENVEGSELSEGTCCYFMWRQAFPVKHENKVSMRNGDKEWVISLAFPYGERLRRGTSSVGIFAYLPTAMVTNFPFIIHADFLLTSSRESILLDSKWNLGIFEHVPSAFLNAFSYFVKEASALSSNVRAFDFLPVRPSPIPELNRIRASIKTMLQNEHIIPCEMFTDKIYYGRPNCAIRVPRKFQEILFQIKEEGLSLDGLNSMEKLVLHSSLCDERYGKILEYVGVVSASNQDWYEKCFKVCNILLETSEKSYMELLCFVHDHNYNAFKKIPLLKYVNLNGKVELLAASSSKKIKVLYALDSQLHAWLSNCNEELRCPNMYFLPNSTQLALLEHTRSQSLVDWLRSFTGLTVVCSACGYGYRVSNAILKSQAYKYAQFLFHSYTKGFMNWHELSSLCPMVPTIDGSGALRPQHQAVTVVSASGSKWSKLFRSVHPFSCPDFVVLSDIYAKGGNFAGCSTPEKELLGFLTKHTKALDIPELRVPDSALQIVSSELTSEQAFLLLDWIQFHRSRGVTLPTRFLKSIQGGRWMKTCSGFKPPKKSFLLDESGSVISEITKNVLNGFNVVDQEFYGNRINLYAEELRLFGVGFGLDDVKKHLLAHFKSIASFGMKKEFAVSMLMFISILKERNGLDKDWLEIIKDAKWLKTCRGYYAPRGSVFLHSEVEVEIVSKTTNLSAVDQIFYDGKISSFLSELELLEVVLEQKKVYSLVAESFTLPTEFSALTADCGLLILKCIKNSESPSSGLFNKFINQPWLKTNLGMKCPSESILPDLEWTSLLLVVELPIIDEAFYGSEIGHYISELKSIGVATDINSILKVLANKIKILLSSNSFTAVNVFLLLNYIRETSSSVSQELCNYLLEEKWLKTRHGFKAPNESILFSPKWGTVSLFVDLPLIDDSFYGLDIYGYKDELKMMGVITDFEGGAPFLVTGLKRSIEPTMITTEGTLFILECMKSLMSENHDQQIPVDFLSILKKGKWLKTRRGYDNPENCILFDDSWKSILKRTDAPMIDEQVYGTNISAYKNPLKAIGVRVDAKDVCALLYGILPTYLETSLIRRIYMFLREFQFHPEFMDISSSQLWIPNQNFTGGEWVDSQVCVLHDRHNLFSSQLYSLDRYYKKELMPMFISVYGVAEFPSLDNYLQLWNFSWALRENHQVTAKECFSFWAYILGNWNPDMEKQLMQKMIKLPAQPCTGDEIHLVSKEACFLPDDLQLKKMFMSVGTGPLFAWFPKSSSVYSRKLYEIYTALGVRKISGSVECTVGNISSSVQSKQAYARDGLLNKYLIRLVLGFLAGPQINMPIEDRHKAAKSLIDLSVLEMTEPIKISYQLILTADEKLEVETRKMVLWEKNSQLLLIDGSGYEDQRANIEFVSCFAHEIAAGIVEHSGATAVDNLSKIIEMAFMFGFEEDAVEFLLTRENLELFMEDEQFLVAECHLIMQANHVVSPKGKIRKLGQLGPITPIPKGKRQRREVKKVVQDMDNLFQSTL